MREIQLLTTRKIEKFDFGPKIYSIYSQLYIANLLQGKVHEDNYNLYLI